jgi:hypothetical protein
MQIFNNNTAESMHLKCKFAFDGAKISNRNLRRRRVLQEKIPCSDGGGNSSS